VDGGAKELRDWIAAGRQGFPRTHSTPEEVLTAAGAEAPIEYSIMKALRGE
jgi:hypothetical protein